MYQMNHGELPFDAAIAVVEKVLEFWTPDRYAKGHEAELADGKECSISHPDACKFCLTGIMRREIGKISPVNPWPMMCVFMVPSMLSQNPVTINDRLGHAGCVEFLKFCLQTFKGLREIKPPAEFVEMLKKLDTKTPPIG